MKELKIDNIHKVKRNFKINFKNFKIKLIISIILVLSISFIGLFIFDTRNSDPIVKEILIVKEIKGYYSLYATQDNWNNIRFDIITTLALSTIAPKSNGDLREDYDEIIPDELIAKAHDNGVKVIFSFGPQTGSTRIIDSILGDENSKENLLNNILGIIQRHNFDGIDIDIEGVNPTNSVTGTSNKKLMTNFVEDLRNKLDSVNPDYKIHMAIGSYYQDEDKIFDLEVLQNYVDYIMIMGYDYNIGHNIGSNAPIDEYDYGPSISDSMAHYSSIVSSDKLLLGVPWYGYERPAISGDLRSPSIGDGIVYDFQDMKKAAMQYGRIWDNTWKTPWYKYQVGTIWYQGHYDDIESLGIKYDFVNAHNLSGIGIWNLGYGHPELWRLTEDKFRQSKLEQSKLEQSKEKV